MLKTISAALLAVSVLAAPALAESGKTTANTPVTKTTQAKSTNTKAEIAQGATTQVKPAALNANARMGRHHHRGHRSYHHRHHRKMAAMKTTQPRAQARTALKPAIKATTFKSVKVSPKPVASTTRRG